MKLIKRDIQVWVMVAEDMPIGDSFIHTNLGLKWLYRGSFYDNMLRLIEVFPNSWLKIEHDVYVLTEDDLDKIKKELKSEGYIK